MKKLKTKHLILLVAIATNTVIIFAQTPFDSFALNKIDKTVLHLPSETFTVHKVNNDSIALNSDNQTLNLFCDGTLIKSMQMENTSKKFINVDPLADKYPGCLLDTNRWQP